ncbi:MAG: GH92 family glycosyl hydrolase [Bacteroidota bacterium]|nr:GH92 family glycosyl hydrolase [Bacteroidota bacterium]
MNYFSVKTLLSLALLAMLNIAVKGKDADCAKYVDPFIGTGYHGHVFLGAHVPFGAVQVGPTNFIRGWDWCSGYHYSDSIVTGFSQLHLSGTGIGDLGDVLITPFTGSLKTSPGTEKNPFSGYSSKYSHTEEVAKPGYYSVVLKTYGIKAELTASERVGFHKYTFPENKQSHIAINLEDGIGWDAPVETFLKKVDAQTYTGYRFSKGWANDQRVYFAIKLSKPVDDLKLFDAQKAVDGNSAKGKAITGILSFATQKGEEVMLKVGISPVSEQNALNNIDAEVSGWDFTQTSVDAYKVWNRELGKVQVAGSDIHNLRTFYTAVYHLYTAPVLFNDHNKDYRGTDKKVYVNPGFNNYSIFSLWDTYRAAQPLFTILQPERVNDMVNSLLAIYKQQGKLPIWPLMGSETDCMVGYSAVPVIADAYFEGFNGFDLQVAFDAMKSSSTRDDYGVKYLKERGYIPADKEPESVSKALEYCISDWCIAQMAKKLGKTADYEIYSKRALLYRQYFDSSTKFMRAKLDNGDFRPLLNPIEPSIIIDGKEWKDYTEGNAWQYTWLVPQDVEGLIKLFDGENAFISKLDSLFVVKGDLGKNAPPDISGLVGQYAQGNEPSHHITYLYAYAGQQWKTAGKTRYIMRELYSDKSDGLCGNEDCGQMSAWYIFSAMGFYPVNPANSAFVFGSPLFSSITIKVPGGKQFMLKANNNSTQNIYIQSARFNGKPYTKSFITYKEIMQGGTLEFEMGATPNKKFGAGANDRPKSIIY